MNATMNMPPPSARVRSPWRSVAGTIGLTVLLAGCYFPASFDAEIEISRSGLYKMSFDGYIVDLNHYREFIEEKIKPGDEKDKERQKTVLGDFNRNRGTISADYFGKGAYKLNWTQGGDLISSGQVTFFRRNEDIFTIVYDKNKGTMSVRGKFIRTVDRPRLTNIGLTMKGVLRVKTDARVLNHNAQKVTDQGAIKIYGWRINSVNDPTPKMVLALR
jgi:hypothetical protein